MLSGPLLAYTTKLPHTLGLATGDLRISGALIKNVTNGQIVGHVQPTSLLQNAISMSASPLNFATGLAGVVQNEQIKNRLTEIQSALGSLQVTQFAAIGVSLAGLGVTVASTAVILHRMKRLEDGIAGLEAQISDLPKKWRDMAARDILVDLRTQTERLEESAHRSDETEVLSGVETALNLAFNRFDDYLGELANDPAFDGRLLAQMLAALSLCGETRLKALFAMDEAKAAASWSAKTAESFEKIAWSFPRDRLNESLGDAAQASDMAKTIEVLNTNTAGRAIMTDHVVRLGVSPRAMLEQASSEEDEPLLFLPAPKDDIAA